MRIGSDAGVRAGRGEQKTSLLPRSKDVPGQYHQERREAIEKQRGPGGASRSKGGEGTWRIRG